MALPSRTPQLNVDDFSLSRVQDNITRTTDAILSFLNGVFLQPTGGQVSLRASNSPHASQVILSAETLSGTNALAPMGSGELVGLPFSGSIVSMTISSINATNNGPSAPSAGAFTGFIYKNGVQQPALSVSLVPASPKGIATTAVAVGVITFVAGDYIQMWRSTSSLVNPGSNRYITSVWATINAT